MKVKIEVDCTPEEARAFLGLPDIGPMQDEIIAGLKSRMEQAAARFEPEAMLKEWMSTSGDGMNQVMKMWRQMMEKPGKD